jgi:hypothetical protein
VNRTELADLIHNGESSGVELKRDNTRPERLASISTVLGSANTRTGCL